MNPSVIRNIKSVFQSRLTISRVLAVDCEAAKTLFANLCFSHPKSKIVGYIQDVALDPFGITFFSYIQVNRFFFPYDTIADPLYFNFPDRVFKMNQKGQLRLIKFIRIVNFIIFIKLMMWLSVRKRNPIWYFDATGNVIKSPERQKLAFLYSIAYHDPETHTILSIADFITTSHTENKISKYLSSVKHLIETNYSKRIIAPIIVTDASMVLLNSVLTTFNNCSLKEYLIYTYEILVGETQNLVNFRSKVKVILYICSTHYLKIVLRAMKKISIESKTKSTFIYTFSLLQNSLTIKELTKNFVDLYYLFVSPFKSSLQSKALLSLKSRIQSRNDNAKINLHYIEPTEKESLNDCFVGLEQNDGTIKASSPFTIYFNQLVNDSKTIIRTNTCSADMNPYYCPELIDIILQRIHLVPLWSSIMIGDWQKANKVAQTEQFSRISNNSVEQYFNIVKTHLLKNRKVMISELGSLMYNKNLAKFNLYYKSEELDHIPHLNDELEDVEKWNRGKTTKPKKPDNRTFHQAPRNVDYLFGDRNTIEECREFIEATRGTAKQLILNT